MITQLVQWLAQKWLLFVAWFDDLSQGLQERVAPLSEQLVPLWEDPIWRALLVVVLLLIAGGFIFIAGKWGLAKVGELIGKGVTLISSLFSWLSHPLGAFFSFSSRTYGQLRRQAKRRAAIRQRMRRIMEALRYLTTPHQWRYRSPWYLALGDTASDRKGLLKTIKFGRKTELLNQEQKLQVAGTEWLFFDKGVVIEIKDDVIDDLQKHPNRDNKFSDVLDLLLSRRPERALDGVILSISGRSLLDADSAGKRVQLANALFQQLWLVQKYTGFRLPVYVLISECEQIWGFEAFWDVQSSKQREEIIGWSNPNQLETAFSPSWVNEAFDSVLNGLQTAQLMVAAGNREINHIDDFMLHHQYFRRLQEPLRAVLEGVFAQSNFSLPMPVRGIYFCGSNQQQTVGVEQLFHDKVFGERNLALPVSKVQFSKQRTLRHLQISVLSVAALLIVGLVVDTARMYQHNSNFSRVIDQMIERQQAPQCSALGRGVFDTLNHLSTIGEDQVYPTLVSSWFDIQFQNNESFVAKEILKPYVFKDMECRLKKHACAIQARFAYDAAVLEENLCGQNQASEVRGHNAQTELQEFSLAISEYYKFRKWFVDLSGPLSSDEFIKHKFSGLLGYLYDIQDKKKTQVNSPLVLGGIKVMDYIPAFSQKKNALLNPDKILKKLHEIAQARQQTLLSETVQNPTHDASNNQPLAQVRQLGALATWLQNMHARWGVPYTLSPCAKAAESTMQALSAFELNGLISKSTYNSISGVFDRETCYLAARDKLVNTGIPPFGKGFEIHNDLLMISEDLGSQMAQFAAMQTLSFVLSPVRQVNNDSAQIVSWRLAPLQQALAEIYEFQDFQGTFSSRNLDKVNVTAPLKSLLFNSLARHIEEAKVTSIESTQAVETEITSLPENQLAANIENFAQVKGELTLLLKLLGQLGDKKHRLLLQQSIQGFILDQFSMLAAIMEQEKPLAPQPQPDWQAENFALAVYDVKDEQQLQGLIAKQQGRVSYLAYSYAEPLVSYLLNNGGVNNGGEQATRWLNTLSALNRFQRHNDQNDVSYFQTLLTKTLAKEQNTRCDTLGFASTSELSDSWFSQSYMAVEKAIEGHCKSTSANDALSQYALFSKQFNRLLAGRFPFASLQYAGKTDVSIEVVQGFFDNPQNDPEKLLSRLKSLNTKQPGKVPVNWIAFLESLVPFKQWLEAGSSQGASSWQTQLNVQFDVLPQGPGADQILQWQLASRYAQISFPNGGDKLAWSVGEPLTLHLQWANSSAYLPFSLKTIEGVSIDPSQNVITFASQGQWGMFEWLLKYANPQLKQQTGQSDKGDLLTFNVPVSLKTSEPQMRKVAYVSQPTITIDSDYVNKDGVVQSLKWPLDLPTSAPGGH